MTRLLRLGVTAAAVASGLVIVDRLMGLAARDGYALGVNDAEANVESCGYCGVPPAHWGHCPLYPAEGAYVALGDSWQEGHDAAIRHLAEGVSTPNPYLQSTEGGA
jgi:hypothetical protein